jgi:hypothetical protein
LPDYRLISTSLLHDVEIFGETRRLVRDNALSVVIAHSRLLTRARLQHKLASSSALSRVMEAQINEAWEAAVLWLY